MRLCLLIGHSFDLFVFFFRCSRRLVRVNRFAWFDFCLWQGIYVIYCKCQMCAFMFVPFLVFWCLPADFFSLRTRINLSTNSNPMATVMMMMRRTSLSSWATISVQHWQIKWLFIILILCHLFLKLFDIPLVSATLCRSAFIILIRLSGESIIQIM